MNSFQTELKEKNKLCVMAKYPTKSIFNPTYWDEIVEAFTLLTANSISTEQLSEDFIWRGMPIGKYLERVRQVRCENKLTVEEMKIMKKLHVDMQYLERRWTYMYQRAKAYYLQYGHLSISSKEDLELSKWVADQRRRYVGGPRKRKNRIAVYTPLTDEQRKLLEEIEIVWDTSSTWYKYSPLLKKYYEEMHDTNVPTTFFVGHLNLGHWVNSVRRGYFQLTEEQKDYLDSMKFDWDIRTVANTSFPEQATLYYFSFCYPDAQKTKEGGKELDIYSEKARIAIEYDGVAWQKNKNKFDKDNEKDEYCYNNGIRLIRIREEGLPCTKYATNYFISLPFSTDKFDTLLRKIFQKEFGNPLVDIDTRAHGFEILKNYRKLEDMAFYRHLEELKEYIRINHSFPPSNRKSHAGLLGWIYNLRRIYIGQTHGVLTNEMIQALNEVDFVWNPSEYKLNNIYIHLKIFVEQGHDYLPSNYKDPIDDFTLGYKVSHLRQRGPSSKSYGGTKLSNEWIEKFNALGMNWTPGEPLLIPKTRKKESYEESLFDTCD